MAYTYTGTPNQRIEQAKRRISTESVDVNSTLSAYQNRVAEIQQQEQAQAQQQEYESNASGIVRFGDTLGEFFKDVVTGIEKAFEGIIDFGAGTIGTIAGWAGNNTLKQEMTNFVARDLIGEQWDAARNAGLDVDFDDSYINDLSETGQGIVKGVAEGIGQMLPMVVATVATGGAAGAAATAGKITAGTANAIVKAGQVANMVGLGASAAGRGTEEALNTEIVDEYGNVTKPTLDRAYLYGLATGAVEMATEKLVGGIYSKAVGGGIADNLISKLAKSAKFSKAVKFGLDVMGEGVEEMVSASVEKTLQTIYNSTDGKMHWENPDIQDVFVSGVVGTLTSAVMGGGQVAVRKASSVATTQDAMLDIENTLKKANNLSKKGKLAEQAEALESEINKSAELIARRYQRASDKGKERLLAIQGVRELLAEDGSVRKTALNEGVAEISREKAVGAMSGSLALTRRNEVANVVAAQNTTIAESLDTEQKSNFAKLEKMLELTGKEAGKQMKVVALEKHEANAFIKDDVMYISKDRLADKNATARDFAHEVFHFAEGTKEYRDVAKMFDRMTIDGKNLFDLATDEVKSLGYEVDAKVFEMLKEGKTAEEITNTGITEHDVRLALSEIRAKQSEMMFGNAEVITKMAEADQSLAKKILKRIKGSIKVIETVFKGDKETLETLKVLRQAEKLWQDALAVSGSKNAVAKQSRRDIAVDSQGHHLSKEQIEYFKDSKVVNENGDLLVVYHGTGETFTQFRRNMIYFSDNADVADSYARDGKEIMAGYLNITKPFVVDAKGSKWSRIPLSANVKRFLDKFEISTFYEDGANRTTPADIAVAIMDAIESGADYDGVIIRNIDDTGRYWKKSPTNLGTDYIAFSSSQFKNLDNKKPTESNDIRYSLRVGDEDIAVDNEILTKKQAVALRDRGVVGDAFLNAEDLAKEILSVGGTITEDGKAVLYHGTTAEAAAKIKESGKMIGKEPNLFFSTKKDGLILDYGESVVEVQIPLEKLELNDIFDDELHLTMATQPNRPTNVRFSLRESIEDDVLKKYGKTYRWEETGYLLKDGSRLDLSGRNEGATGGYRTVDHRDIFYDEDETDGTDAMIEFMQRGNIRVMPEQAGINLQIEPTEAQYRQIQNLVETLGWKNKEFSVDFDNANGDTIDNLYYEGNVPARKVIADIRYYFKEGKTPYQSELSKFRYSLRENATDSNGRELTDRQVAYFQDSKVRDKDGNLLVMYHGTDAYKEINVFKKGKSGYLGGGIYLTSDKAYAERYANKNGYKGTIYETYVNAENPLVVTSVDVAREILKAIYGTDTVWKKRTEKQASVTDLITNADINKLRAKGYDGILWDYANSIEISVFESNQIKRVDNENPTYNDDVRFSKRYIYHAGKFNETGHKAETLYTSTPSRHTGFFGTGTYGVDSDHIHELSLGSYKGKPFSVIDISQYNLFDATNDDTAARLHRFLKDITRKAFESKNSEKVNILYNQFKALFPSDKVIAYDEFKSLIDELKQYVKDNEGYTKSKDLDSVSTKFMKHFGYEGVNTIGTYHADTEYGTVIYDLREDSIVVKESTDETQRKAFTDDVRYSKRSFGDTKTKVELLKSLQGMQLDYYGKYYAKIEDPASFFEEGSLGDRLANQILAMADEAEPNKYAFANDLATHIVNNLAVTTVDDYGLKVVLDNANAIREYRHKLNLDGIKGEIQYRYGKKNSIFALWKAKKGTTGTYIMDAVDELRYKGVIINAEVDADAFFEMLDMVEFANEQANKVLSGTAKDYLKADEYDALVEGLRDDILSFMENKGTKAEWENYYKAITRQADAYLERAKQKARDIEKLATLEAENALEKAKHAYDKDARKLQNEYETKIKEITNEMQQMALNDIEYNQRYNDLVSKVWSEANSLTMDNIKKYKNAGDLLNNEFAGVVKKLSGIKWRGELKKSGTRKIIAEFGKWYNTNNPLLTGGLDQAEIDKMMADDNVVSIGYLDKFALRGIEIMRENQTRESMAGKTKGQQIPNDKQLTYDELMICKAVLSSARHILQSYNTLQIAKQRVKLDETATKTNNLATTMSKITHLKHKTTDKILGLMMQALTPADVIGYQFGYQDNALSDLFQQIQDGETHARSLEIDLNDIIDNFFKEHKHYKKTLSSTIKFGEHEIRRDVALSLYMLSLQEDSREGLLLGGWGYTDDTGYWKEQGKMTEGEIRELSQALSNTDKDFVKTLRRFFNAAGEAMAETDMMLKGYSLVDGNANSHYFPIKRYSGDMAKSVADVDAIKNAMSVSVANFSFTHERVKNIRRIDVRPVLSVVKTHAKQVSLYNGLALPIKEFQRLYNFNVADDGSTNSLRNTINEKSWNGFHKYVTKLFEDIQSEKGIKAENGAVSRVLGRVRSNYAKFQLGANMKTWFAQLSGYPAALPYLSPQSMAKAFTKSLYWKSQNAQNLYKYCEWAKVKAHDGGVVLVETLSDKIGVVGDIATKPIQLMDNFLNRILWNAAQFEIERTKGFKFGTKENMEHAGQLHTLLGRKTQGNAATSELSAMQRHTSETVKMLAMFNSDGFKMLSRLFEGITRVRVQNYLAKHNPGMVTAKSQKEAKTFLAKTTTAILTSALIYTLVGELFKFLYDKERKDKDGNEVAFAEDFGMSYLSTVVGMIPIMRDIYSLVVEGYEVDNYALSGITDFITSFEGIAEGVTILASGEPFESKDLARPLKDLVNALGQLTGIPTRNVYNTIYGLTKRFDASAAYKWDSIFYAQGYTKDLKKAIEKDDVDLQKTIIGLMLKDNGLTDTSEKVNNKLRELYAEGYTVLPKTVQDTLHYDGETYNLSNKQVKQFKAVYGKANEEVEDLVNDRHFTSLAAEVQAQAIKWIYDYYYESAVFDTIGEEADSKKQLFGETMDVSKFALTIAACKSIESKLDKKGNVIAGSRKVQIQRLLASLNLSPAEKQLILAYLGYSVADQETLIKAFIRRIGLTKSQQKLLLSYCGIAV